ncbi:MAG: hypothetical protein OXD30_11090, partial [Bryobacterales bacterium]|nr:hypothetical protein [Bryobacterales bacterium]
IQNGCVQSTQAKIRRAAVRWLRSGPVAAIFAWRQPTARRSAGSNKPYIPLTNRPVLLAEIGF